MAVTANTNETYDNSVIREDLQEQFKLLSNTETPLMGMAGERDVSNTLFDWPIVELAAPDRSNRVVEGESSVSNDTPNNALRISNYTQISDKTAEVSHTAEAVDAAASNVQRLNKQVVLKMKEMKRDMEVMLLDNVVAAPASSGNARGAAGLPAFLRTNSIGGAGGADPALSGGAEGYPSTGVTTGTPALFTEDMMNQVIEACWNEGGTPSIVMVNGGNKRRISAAFLGNSSRQKDAVDKKLVAAIDFYDSDFGMMSVVPNRLQPTNNAGGANNSYNVFVLDPEYIKVAYLETVKQKALAETGHAKRRLVWTEYSLQVDNEKSCGIIRDTTNAIA